MLRKVLWTCVIVGLLLFVAVGAIAAYDYCSQPGPAPTPTSLPEGSFIREGVLLGTNEHSDHDGDWVSDRLEFHEHGTNPLKLDTDDDGIDDFNEIFTYPHLLDPLDPTDAEAFLDMIPNVEAEIWGFYSGGTLIIGGDKTQEERFVGVAKRDPLVKWYAEHTTIEWQEEGRVQGLLKVNGELLFLEYGYVRGASQSSYYLTHGRKGVCGNAAIVHYTILELMGYECWLICGENHAWLEANIDGEVYVVNYNFVQQVDLFYQANNWTIAVNGRKDL